MLIQVLVFVTRLEPNDKLSSSLRNTQTQFTTSAPPWLSTEATGVCRARYMFLKVSQMYLIIRHLASLRAHAKTNKQKIGPI